MNSVSDKELPGLYQSANTASMKAQKNYFCYTSSYLIFLIIGAVLAFIPDKSPEIAVTSASCFLLTLGIMILLAFNKPDDIWYNGRAVAESVKTSAWKFMMNADPYHVNESNATQLFINNLKDILEQNKTLGEALGNKTSTCDPISNIMKTIRSHTTADKIAIYKNDRVEDQADWYSNKAQHNRRNSNVWFGAMIFLHAIAISMLLYGIKDPLLKLPVEIIAVCASSSLSWFRSKKYRELASSYSLAANEISIIKGELALVTTKAQLSDFVVNAENAFSREHTQWIARKNS